MFSFRTLKLTTVTLLATTVHLALVQATPIVLQILSRDVIVPKIITPNADTVWTVGHIETVSWNTSGFPPDSQISNPIGKVILGRQTNNSLNLDFHHPLASGFRLRDGSVKLTVPDVPPRNDYLIVLYGDSGNTSPAFTITKITRESTASLASPPSSSSISSSYTIPCSDITQPPPPPSSSVEVPDPSSSSSTPADLSSTTSVQASDSAAPYPPWASTSSTSLSYPSFSLPATAAVQPTGLTPPISSNASSRKANKSTLMVLISCITYYIFFFV